MKPVHVLIASIFVLTNYFQLESAPIRKLEFRCERLGSSDSVSVEMPANCETVVLWLPGSGPISRLTTGIAVELRSEVRSFCLSHGVGFCAFDKRGTGVSDGSLAAASLDDLTEDAAAVLHVLHDKLLTVNGKSHRLGIAGHSEGAIIASRLARDRHGLATFYILFCPPMLPGEDFLVAQQIAAAKNVGYGATMLRQQSEFAHKIVAIIRAESDDVAAGQQIRMAYTEIFGAAALASVFDRAIFAIHVSSFVSPWARSLLHFNPAEELRNTAEKIVMIFAKDDVVVPLHENLSYAQAQLSAKAASVRFIVEDGRDHFFSKTSPKARDVANLLVDAMGDWPRNKN
jgi:pimeloyl-ACP methyl ester carboxylesterase